MVDTKTIEKIRPHAMILVAASLAVATLETFGVYLLINEQLDVSIALLCHLVIIIFSVLFTVVLHKKNFDVNILAAQALLTLFIGPFGSLIGLAATLRYLIYSQDADAFADWLESLFPEDESTASDKLFERISFGLNDKDGEYVESFYDLMIYGSIINKQTLIARVTRYFKPALTPVLHMALQDENNIIRVQAAASIAKIEDEFFTSYREYETELMLDQDSYKANIAFSLSCIEYIESGILGDKRIHEIGYKTVKTLSKCLELFSTDDTPRFLLGRLYLHLDDPQKSYDIVKPAIKEESFVIPEMLSIFMQAMYQLRKFKELRAFCVKYTSNEMSLLMHDEEIENYFSIWSSCMIKPEWSDSYV